MLRETAAVDQTVLFGRNIMGIMEGDAVLRIFIPRLIELWRQGRFPFDKLIKIFRLEQINEAEQAVVKGEVVKPVLVPAGWQAWLARSTTDGARLPGVRQNI